MSLDPTLIVVVHLGLAILFVQASIHKLRDLAAFREAVAGYRIVPERGVPVAAGGLAAVEIGLSAALIVPGLGPTPMLASAALLLLYAFAIGLNLVRGRRDIECGCAGRAKRRSLHAGLVARNLVLAGLALIASLPAGPRDLHWIDGITIAGVIAAAVALYAAADCALANAPHLAGLKVRS
jgi:hypothetical protein